MYGGRGGNKSNQEITESKYIFDYAFAPRAQTAHRENLVKIELPFSLSSSLSQGVKKKNRVRYRNAISDRTSKSAVCPAYTRDADITAILSR